MTATTYHCPTCGQAMSRTGECCGVPGPDRARALDSRAAAPPADRPSWRGGQSAYSPPGDADDWADLMSRPNGHSPPVEAPEPEEEAELPEVPPFPHTLARGPLRDLLDWAWSDGLPVSYVAASAETVAAAACARTDEGEPGARLVLGPTRQIDPVLWQALIGDSGAGKNPSMRMALAPVEQVERGRLADWQAARESGDDEAVRPEPLALTSTTIESLARWLACTGGAGLMRNGELGAFLRGLGQYKAGGGSDRYDAMDIWSCEPIRIQRVGDGGSRNAVRIEVPHPRLSVVGGLVLDNVYLLGTESDGLRARFLPVLPSSEVRPNIDGSAPLPESWLSAITALYRCPHPRAWYLRGESREAMRAAVAGWTGRQREGIDPKVIRTALAKADEQALRLALVVAELASPGTDGEVIPLWAVEYAVARVEYALGCWLALGTDQTLTFSRRDEVLSRAVADLLRRVEARPVNSGERKYMTRRDIQMARVAGANSPQQVDELIREYLTTYPGCVTVYSDRDRAKFPGARLAGRAEHPADPERGPAPAVVWAPRRVPLGSPRTLGKPLNSTVSGKRAESVGQSPAAGHRPSTSPGSPLETVESPRLNSFGSTVSGPDEPELAASIGWGTDDPEGDARNRCEHPGGCTRTGREYPGIGLRCRTHRPHSARNNRNDPT